MEHFQLVTAPNGVAYMTCTGLGTTHGFSTRLGGESEGPFDSLNLGVSAGDDEPTVRRNRARWAEALGVEAADLVEGSGGEKSELPVVAVLGAGGAVAPRRTSVVVARS